MTTILDRAPASPLLSPTDLTEAEIAALVAALTRRGLIRGGLAFGALSFLPGCGPESPATATPATTRAIDTARER